MLKTKYTVNQCMYVSWSAIIRINTEGKSLIMKLGPDHFILTTAVTYSSVQLYVRFAISFRY